MSDIEPRCAECIKRVDAEREFIATFVETAAHHVGHGYLATEIRNRKQRDPFRDLTELCMGHLERSGLLDRKVREAVEAAMDKCIKDIRDKCTACDDGHSGDREADGTSIECMYCGIPIRHIRARKETSRRQVKGT